MAARQYAQHVRVSSTDELSYSSSAKGEINDTIQTIVTGRKCWKTMKGKGEVVWPPFLEAALVEGLEKYQPVESRTTRAFGRFPMRNKFISDYIFDTTGKRRTPKQVGSRLQQLRDTTEGKRILQLLSSRHMSMMQPKAAHKDSSVEPSSSGSSSPSSPSSPLPPCSYVSIDVLPASAPSSPTGPSPLVPAPGSPASFRAAAPRVLRDVDPTVSFLSRAPLAAHSHFRVLRANAPVHAERTALLLRDTSLTAPQGWASQMECRFVYSTEFVPRFWARLCEAADPAEYIVVQDIVRSGAAPPAMGTAAPGDVPAPADVLMTVVYQFTTPAGSPPLSPAPSSSLGSTTPRHDGFSAESSPELGSDFDELLFQSALEPPAPHHGSQHPFGAGPPGLITRDEEGYASLPPSPLDALAPADWHALPPRAASCAPPQAYADVDFAAAVAGYDAGGYLPQYTFDPVAFSL